MPAMRTVVISPCGTLPESGVATVLKFAELAMALFLITKNFFL